MKKKLQRFSNYSMMHVVVAMLILELGSCVGESPDEQPRPDDATELVISLGGIEGEVEDEVLLSAKTSSKSRTESPESEIVHSYIFNDFDAQVSSPADDGYAVNAWPRQITERKAGSGNRMAVVPVGGGIKYRIVLYRSDGAFFNSVQAVSGTELKVSVALGETYRWYAYSYNDDQDVANLPNQNVPVVPSSTTRDLMTATGTIAITAKVNYPLNIVFQHRTNRVGVEINTMGMFSTLTAASLTLGGAYFSSGNYNMSTGELTGVSSSSPTLTAANLVNLPGTTTGDQKIAYYYTLNSAAISTMRVTLSNLSVTPYGSSTARVFTGQQASFQFSVTAFTSSVRSKKARIDLIESPLTLGTVGGASVRWARSNLFLNGNSNTGHNPYRFYATNERQTARESFWPWRSLLPNGQTGTGDPCRQVYPLNAWRTPLPTEYQAILPATHTFVSSGNRHINYTTATGTGAPYSGTTLTFYANGFGNTIGLVASLIEIDLSYSQQNTRAHLWADNQVVDFVAQIGTYYYLMTDKPAGIVPLLDPAEQSTTVVTAALNNIGIIGITILSAGYRNVRCVRNPGVPTTTVP